MFVIVTLYNSLIDHLTFGTTMCFTMGMNFMVCFVVTSKNWFLIRNALGTYLVKN